MAITTKSLKLKRFGYKKKEDEKKKRGRKAKRGRVKQVSARKYKVRKK